MIGYHASHTNKRLDAGKRLHLTYGRDKNYE